MISDHWLYVAITDSIDVGGAAVAGLAGDDTARSAVLDYAAEHWGAEMTPFEVGKDYLIQTVTLYYVGRVVAVTGAFVVLERASWVHWTGRLSTLCRTGKFTGFPSGDARPRTEFIGRRVGVNLGSIVDYIEGPFVLPGESIQ